MMGRMLHVLQDLTQFVTRISDLVKHAVQQLASLYSPEGYVGVVMNVCVHGCAFHCFELCTTGHCVLSTPMEFIYR